MKGRDIASEAITSMLIAPRNALGPEDVASYDSLFSNLMDNGLDGLESMFGPDYKEELIEIYSNILDIWTTQGGDLPSTNTYKYNIRDDIDSLIHTMDFSSLNDASPVKFTTELLIHYETKPVEYPLNPNQSAVETTLDSIIRKIPFDDLSYIRLYTERGDILINKFLLFVNTKLHPLHINFVSTTRPLFFRHDLLLDKCAFNVYFVLNETLQ